MKKSEKENTAYNPRGLHGLAALSFQGLIRLKEDNHQIEFNKAVQQLLPDVNSYIARRLSAAVRNGHLPSGKYKVEDFTDEIYLKAYDQIKEVEDERDLLPWLFKKADELLQNIIVDEEFNETFFENIDNYSQSEWKQMQADFSTDGDGDLILLEEFDDPSYPDYEYTLKDVFVEESPENEWLEKLNSELGDGQIHAYIDMVLHHLPTPMRSIYDLAVNQRFEPYEIAKIKQISVYQVEQYLKQARRSIRVSLKRRFTVEPKIKAEWNRTD